MDRVHVSSSTLTSVGYDPATRTLDLEFTNGHLYRYFEVPPDTHAMLMAASSKGQFFNASIRDVFRYEKVE